MSGRKKSFTCYTVSIAVLLSSTHSTAKGWQGRAHGSKIYLQVPLCLLSTALITLMDHFLELAPQLCVHILKHISPVDGLLHHIRGN